jgi:hypothetical protein
MHYKGQLLGGPKKVENSGPTPITGPSNAYFPPEIHYFPLHKKHRCIGNFMYMSFRAHIYVYVWVSGPTTVCQLTSLCVCVEGGRAREGGKVICGR